MYKLLLCGIGFYFVIRLLYFAFVIPHDTPPDEHTHMERIMHFNSAVLMPSDDLPSDQAHLRMSSHAPYLYYIIAGKWLSTNVMGLSDLFYMRLLSIIFACFTLVYGLKLVRLLSENRIVHTLFLILLTNTIMFSFISASASYDAMTNLLSAMIVFYLAEFTLKRTSQSLVYLCLSIALGGLTKITLLPLSFAAVLCFFVLHCKEFKHIKSNLKPFWEGLGKRHKGWAIVAFVCIGLNGILYGGNLMEFGHLVPKADQLLSDEEILTNPVYARNDIYLDFVNGEKNLNESLERAQTIQDRFSRMDTSNLLQGYAMRQETQGEFVPMSRIAYSYYWYRIMLRSTYGILGHSTTLRSFAALIPFNCIFVLVLCSLGFQAMKRRVPTIEIALLGMLAFYGVLLMQQINYSAYCTFHLPHIAVQGRYMFPLIVPVYALIAKYILAVPSTKVQLAIASMLTLLFVYGDFIFFLKEWGN